MMTPFHYVDGKLYCEELALEWIVERLGTPVYVYSQKSLVERFQILDEAFAEVDHLICYALKANGNLSIIRQFQRLGAGADVVSRGELYLALQAGIEPQKIVFAGVGKRDDEIEYALSQGILALNVESEEELRVINRIAARMGKKAPVNIRVNPDIDPKSHPYISTGLAENKFGIDISQAPEVFQLAQELEWIDLLGVHCHIGSQITDIGPFEQSARSLSRLWKHLHSQGIRLQLVDIGGGIGVNYHPHVGGKGETSSNGGVDIKALAQRLLPILKPMGCRVLLEPGRYLIAEAGALITRVLYIKKTPRKTFVVVDAAMNDLLRPSLYQAYHEIVPLDQPEETSIQRVDVVGPVCESADFFAKDRELPLIQRGDLLAILTAGAYGYSMSSNYNARPRVPEILISGREFAVIRERESIENLM